MTEPMDQRAPLWGTATVKRDEDTGKLYWDCEIETEDCDVKQPVIELGAEHFNLGTIVKVYEPVVVDVDLSRTDHSEQNIAGTGTRHQVARGIRT